MSTCCWLCLKGKTREALQVLQDALGECTRWGELDVQGLLMFEGAKLEVQRGKTGNGMAMLKVPRAKCQDQWQPTGYSSLSFVITALCKAPTCASVCVSVYKVCVSVQETINLLSGETQLPPGSTLTLARAILLLHELREGPNTALLNLLYGLIKNEVSTFKHKQILRLDCFVS